VLLRRCLLNRLLQTQTSATTILKMWTHWNRGWRSFGATSTPTMFSLIVVWRL
jgi:hypothetical protein